MFVQDLFHVTEGMYLIQTYSQSNLAHNDIFVICEIRIKSRTYDYGMSKLVGAKHIF